MSGFEAVGLVLALYPVVAAALAHCKAVKPGADISRITEGLETEQIIFDDFVFHLLGSRLSEGQRDQLRTTGHVGQDDGWNDPGLQADLRRRLGLRKVPVVLSIIENIHKLLASMYDGLSTVGAHQQPSPIRYLRSKHNPFKKQLDELRGHNKDLQRLLGSRPLSDPAGQIQKRTVTIQRRDCSDALDVYKAIRNGYKCDCDTPHLANLILPRSIFLDSNHDESIEPETSDLQLLFSLDESAVTSLAASDLDIAPQPGSEDRTLVITQEDTQQRCWSITTINTNDCHPIQASRHRRTSEVTIRECVDEQHETINDLCAFLRALDSGVQVKTTIQQEEPGILCSDQKRYRIHTPPPSATSPDPKGTFVSLHDFLNNSSARKQRMRLALELSYAILQYYSTGWIDTSWTWRDFSITGIEGLDAARLFVATRFYSLKMSTSVPMVSNPMWILIGEPILTRLGFALIELAMGKRLSEMRPSDLDTSSDLDTLDYMTALQLLHSGKLQEEAGSPYEAAVKACLDHQFYSNETLKCLDSRQPSFQKDVEECVIGPLHDMWVHTWK